MLVGMRVRNNHELAAVDLARAANIEKIIRKIAAFAKDFWIAAT
jgi:hypothetical protein